MYTVKEQRYIEEFCREIGRSVFPAELETVEKTAVDELKQFFRGDRLAGQKTLIIGCVCNCEAIAARCKRGECESARPVIRMTDMKSKASEASF